MNSYKRLAFNTIIFAIGSFGSKIIALLLNNLYTKHIEPADFYTKNLLETVALFLIPVFTFSLTDALVRFGLDKRYDKKQIFTTASGMIFFGLGLMALTVPFLHFIPFLNSIKDYTFLLIIYVITSSMRSLCSQFVIAKGMVKLFSLDGILTTLTLLIFNLIFITKLGFGVKGFMLSTILSDGCSALFLFTIAKLRNYLDFRSFSGKMGKSMIKFTLPLIPTTVMWTFTGMSDQIFIGNMNSDKFTLGEEAAGIYAAATKIPNLLSMLSTIFFQAWNMSAITENKSANRNKFYEKVYSSYESILFIGSAGLIVFIKPISEILINYDNFPQYETSYIYTPLMITAAIFICLNQFLFGIYTATLHSKNAFWTILAAGSANIVLNFWLIPIWGLQGAAFATFLSYLICYWLRMIDIHRFVPFRFSLTKHWCNLAIILAMCLITIKQPPSYFLLVILLALLVFTINFKSLLTTLMMLLKKDKK